SPALDGPFRAHAPAFWLRPWTIRTAFPWQGEPTRHTRTGFASPRTPSRLCPLPDRAPASRPILPGFTDRARSQGAGFRALAVQGGLASARGRADNATCAGRRRPAGGAREENVVMLYRNLAQMHRRQAERLGPRPALRYRKLGLYHDLSWDWYRAEVEAAACALVEAGVAPGERVGLVAENCVDWLVADLAILAAGAVTVSPHAPLTARQIHYQLHDAGVVWV